MTSRGMTSQGCDTGRRAHRHYGFRCSCCRAGHGPGRPDRRNAPWAPRGTLTHGRIIGDAQGLAAKPACAQAPIVPDRLLDRPRHLVRRRFDRVHLHHLHAFNSIFEGAAQGVAVEITPQRSTSDGVPDSVVDQLRERKQELGIDKIVTNQQGPVTIAGADGKALQTGGAPSIATAYIPPDQAISSERLLPGGRAPMGRTRSSSTPRPPTRAA